MIVPIAQPPAQGEIVVDGERAGASTFVPSAAAPAPPSRIEALSEERFKVQVTATAALRDKLERARDLMRHRNPSGDLALVLDAAVDALLEKLEKDRLGKATRERRTTRPTTSGRVPRAVRREVFARDGERCTFENEQGERCPARGFLELDHIEPRALGGDDDAPNLRVRCRAHNQLYAETVFGKTVVTERIHFRQRKSRHCEPEEEQSSEDIERGVVGLAKMGFKKAAARRALVTVAARHTLPLPELLREALQLLA